MTHLIRFLGCLLSFSVALSIAQYPRNDIDDNVPAPPEPEAISLVRVPLPPVAPSDEEGSCSLNVNPRGTGCVAKHNNLHSGHFLPDNQHFVAIANFTGAPAAPDPSSIYQGQHVLILKADDSTFPNGDNWKCITCGIPEENSKGRSAFVDYPQVFQDGKRLFVGDNIIECEQDLVSEGCTPENTYMRPIRWNTSANGTGPGGAMRELRLHPDNVHLGWSAFTMTNGEFGQFSYYGRLAWNPNPTQGEPLVPRYDVEKAYRLFSANPDQNERVIVHPDDPGQLLIQNDVPTVGELRGFGGTGKEVTYVGAAVESSNVDVFATDLTTGATRRLTSHPEYCDPVDISPDDEWHVVMDTRGTDRQMFLSGLRGIPPLTDIITSSVTSATRNNGQRRFFQPWIIDKYGDRGTYFGQQVNAQGDGIPGGGDFNDPVWNGRADPRWSWDGTKIVYPQIMPYAPACGDPNPLPCYPSTEDGGRIERIIIAHLTDREPLPPYKVEEAADEVPWGELYVPGETEPQRMSPPPGQYALQGKHSGYANVTLGGEGDNVNFVEATYHCFSDDGENFLKGTESVSVESPELTLSLVDWYSNLTQTGPWNGTKLTSPDGFQLRIDVMVNLFDANGTMTTTVNGKEYYQPANGQ